ncbi:MAG: hypothetical protein ACRED9_12335 [Caulobacteraceae bacterium]
MPRLIVRAAVLVFLLALAACAGAYVAGDVGAHSTQADPANLSQP